MANPGDASTSTDTFIFHIHTPNSSTPDQMRLQEDIEKLKMQNKRLRAAIKKRKAERDELEAEREKLKAEIDELRAEYEKLRNERADLLEKNRRSASKRKPDEDGEREGKNRRSVRIR
ncbi:hypothetical protein OC861_000404 [Tilletia horrida]|nr:hypothetical protein OC861_000404 [Tilletia horrida]